MSLSDLYFQNIKIILALCIHYHFLWYASQDNSNFSLWKGKPIMYTINRAIMRVSILMLFILTSVIAFQPATAQARARCFPETGLCVNDTLLSFWERHGGLAVFGFPISDQRSERSAEGVFSSQWFERERFELHPENRAPYNVLLGRLGDEQLRRQGRDWRSFPKGSAQPGCLFFDTTGHTICEPFLSFWRSHGLEFDGRRGTSQAESIALFGLPLSEPNTELNSSGDRVLTQWFERARLEYHPENTADYRILLGRLGAELYDPAAAGGTTQYHSVQAAGWPAALEVPLGFQIEEVASGLNRPRFMALDPTNATLIVAEAGSGRVLRLFDAGQTGRYNASQVIADGFEQMHSVAFVTVAGEARLYAADERRLVHLSDFDESGKASKVETILELPGGARDLYGHRTRTVAQGPDGKLYLSVGSSCDACIEDNEWRASILRMNPDGSQLEVFASGLRNTVGFDWRSDDSLWGVDMGRNNMGADIPPDELNKLERGKNYGWPYCYGQKQVDPQLNEPKRCAVSTAPALDLPAHWAPLGIHFYSDSIFPPAYLGDALVAFHGTGPDQVQTLDGYRVSRIRFRNGQPVAIEDLVRGWLVQGQVWGRPVGLLGLPDGSLLISDDFGGRIFRLRYVGAQ